MHGFVPQNFMGKYFRKVDTFWCPMASPIEFVDLRLLEALLLPLLDVAPY